MRTDTRSKNKIQYLCASLVLLLFICSMVPPSLEASCTGRTASDNGIPTWYQGDQWTYTIDPLSFSSPNGSFTGTVHNLQETVVGIIGDAYEIGITGEITGDITVSGLQGTLTGEITGNIVPARLRPCPRNHNPPFRREYFLFHPIPLPDGPYYKLNTTLRSI